MTKEVLISIKGLQFEGPMDDRHEQVELIVAGSYYCKNGVHYLMYDEQMEGFPEPSRTLIKIAPERVEMSKTGGFAVSMIFIEGQKNMSSYRTPFGNMMMAVDTTGIHIQETEDSLDLEILYHLDMNYEFFAECRVEIKACSKEAGAVLFK
ncbi:MAG: DUF1934 domain-containing protein [Lachnospiraceae bacterium]|nr:DUF1934 domain-containing protein [Lachnospiraceae bacterium]